MPKTFKFAKQKAGYHRLYPSFSFKNYRTTNYFKPSDIVHKGELYYFLINLAGFSQLTWEEIAKKPMFHFHEIEHKNIQQQLGIDETISVIQFKVPGGKQSRIVGFFDTNNIFHIVTYDYHHKVYPRK